MTPTRTEPAPRHRVRGLVRPGVEDGERHTLHAGQRARALEALSGSSDTPAAVLVASAAQMRLFADSLIAQAVERRDWWRRFQSKGGDTSGAMLDAAVAARLVASSLDGTAHTPVVHAAGECRSDPSCMFCDGGLFACSVCDALEGKRTTDCPGAPYGDRDADVYAGKVDYLDGRWIDAPSPFAPGPWSVDDAVRSTL